MAALPDWAQVGPERRAHIERVAALIEEWARRMKKPAAEAERWSRAAYLHDSLRDAPPDLVTRLAGHVSLPSSLLHGPAAAAFAAQQGETDRGVLDAVRYHSVGYTGWDDVGRMLYLADYLEPGRTFRQTERRAMADRVPSQSAKVLREVAAERLQWLIASGWSLVPEMVEFWNGLTRES